MVSMIRNQNKADRQHVVDLFAAMAPDKARRLRSAEQRSRLLRLAEDLAKLLDNLQLELCVDRERAVALLAECSGLLEMAVEEMGEIRDIDEHFGGRSARRPRVATLAEHLERALHFLLGVFSAVGSGENLSEYNWKLISRDIQNVLDRATEVQKELGDGIVKQAA